MKAIPLDAGQQLDELLKVARRSAEEAAEAIRPEFGQRHIVQRRGNHDVQLYADLHAHKVIVKNLMEMYPGFGVVSEEGSRFAWDENGPVWAIDPLDGTNNFGYGVAHCAVAVSLFIGEEVELAVIRDPIIDREFYASRTQPFRRTLPACSGIAGSTISLVAGYADNARAKAQAIEPQLSAKCKRVLNLWAPGLDLALVADGSIDGMICFEADLLDVCAGAFLVKSAGGHLLDLSGNEITLHRSMHSAPLTFVAAMNPVTATQLREFVNAQEVHE